jgi:phosphoglycerate dehydrogenase-like enzyme
VLEASPDLRLVCCACGGPVNVDVEAVDARGLPLVNTPGKNAEAVANLTDLKAVDSFAHPADRQRVACEEPIRTDQEE